MDHYPSNRRHFGSTFHYLHEPHAALKEYFRTTKPRLLQYPALMVRIVDELLLMDNAIGVTWMRQWLRDERKVETVEALTLNCFYPSMGYTKYFDDIANAYVKDVIFKTLLKGGPIGNYPTAYYLESLCGTPGCHNPWHYQSKLREGYARPIIPRRVISMKDRRKLGGHGYKWARKKGYL